MKKIFIVAMAILSMAFYCNVYAETNLSWDHPGGADGFMVIYYKAGQVPVDKTDWADPALGWFKVPDGSARTLGVSDNVFEVGENYVFEGAAYLLDGGLSDWATGDQTTWDGGSFVHIVFNPPTADSQVIPVGPGRPDPMMNYIVE